MTLQYKGFCGHPTKDPLGTWGKDAAHRPDAKTTRSRVKGQRCQRQHPCWTTADAGYQAHRPEADYVQPEHSRTPQTQGPGALQLASGSATPFKHTTRLNGELPLGF